MTVRVRQLDTRKGPRWFVDVLVQAGWRNVSLHTCHDDAMATASALGVPE